MANPGPHGPQFPMLGLAPGLLPPVVSSCFLCVSPQGTHVSHHNEVLRATTENLTENRACFCQSPKPASQGVVGSHYSSRKNEINSFISTSSTSLIQLLAYFSEPYRWQNSIRINLPCITQFLKPLPSPIPVSLIVLSLWPREHEVSNSKSSEFSEFNR